MTQRGALELPAPVRGSAMGRGRAKAKQTKVARQLKYHSPSTDYKALERELSTGPSDDDSYDSGHEADTESEDRGPYEDPYADYYRDQEDHEEDSPDSSASSDTPRGR